MASVTDVLRVPAPADATSSWIDDHPGSYWKILATHTRIPNQLFHPYQPQRSKMAMVAGLKINKNF